MNTTKYSPTWLTLVGVFFDDHPLLSVTEQEPESGYRSAEHRWRVKEYSPPAMPANIVLSPKCNRFYHLLKVSGYKLEH